MSNIALCCYDNEMSSILKNQVIQKCFHVPLAPCFLLKLVRIFKHYAPKSNLLYTFCSKFLLYFCLLPFSILLSLKLNNEIDWSIWIVFIPIWLLDVVIIFGAIIGIIVWFNLSDHRGEREPLVDYKAMLITFGIHILVLMFSGLLCNNIERSGDNLWLLVFTPLFLAFPVSVCACIWGIRNERSLELEMMLSVNILFFIFVALRLDMILSWTWAAVFVPLWIIMSLPCIASLYYFIWSLIYFRSSFSASDRQSHLYLSILWMIIVVTFLTFLILLVYKLDNVINYSWFAVFIPIHICICALIMTSFSSKSGNRWWFGIKIDFCQFLLEHFPCLRLYGNVFFNTCSEEGRIQETETHATDSRIRHIYGTSIKCKDVNITSTLKCDPVIAVDSIEIPD